MSQYLKKWGRAGPPSSQLLGLWGSKPPHKGDTAATYLVGLVPRRVTLSDPSLVLRAHAGAACSNPALVFSRSTGGKHRVWEMEVT